MKIQTSDLHRKVCAKKKSWPKILNFSNNFQYFEHIEEMEWAIEVCKATGMPVAASMCIGPLGDLHGVSSGECAVRMARAGAHVGK